MELPSWLTSGGQSGGGPCWEGKGRVMAEVEEDGCEVVVVEDEVEELVEEEEEEEVSFLVMAAHAAKEVQERQLGSCCQS